MESLVKPGTNWEFLENFSRNFLKRPCKWVNEIIKYVPDLFLLIYFLFSVTVIQNILMVLKKRGKYVLYDNIFKKEVQLNSLLRDELFLS